MNAKSAEMIKAEEEFNQVLDDIEALDTLESCNNMLNILKDGGNVAHKKALISKGQELGFVFNKETIMFEVKTEVENELEA